MRTYNNINLACLHIIKYLFYLFRCAKSRQHFNIYREAAHSLLKCIVVLFRKNGGRHQIRYLLIVLYRLKCRTNSNLRLAEAHISADKAIHYFITFHIPLCLINGFLLVYGFLIRK